MLNNDISLTGLMSLRNRFKLSTTTLSLCLITLILTSAETRAKDHSLFKASSKHSHAESYFLLASNDLISVDQAIEIAKQGRDSKVLKVGKKTQGNREVYRIKLITPKGRVRVMLVDAHSGELLKGKD